MPYGCNSQIITGIHHLTTRGEPGHEARRLFFLGAGSTASGSPGGIGVLMGMVSQLTLFLVCSPWPGRLLGRGAFWRFLCF